ncbi:MAG TPA: hypothetical protein VKR60_03690 [Candidatus Sulfotelmatobacter sp.]|nr:hypothetical protein [Candidatus Sulfotelmatobacter sp.]
MNFPSRIVPLLAIAACFSFSAPAQEAPPVSNAPAPAPNSPAPSASSAQPSTADKAKDDRDQDKTETNQSSQPEQSGTSNAGSGTQPSGEKAAGQNAEQATAPASPSTRPDQEQPKRILGVMPNFRAVSAGALPPPPTAKESFIIATENSFDYSSFIFVGATSALAEWTVAHPQLGQGLPGYGRYYWRGLLDKTDGNYLVIFALPTVFHQDERYYAMGKGTILRRGLYAGSRIVITPDYHGHNSFNISELLGRGMAQGVSVLYYPSGSRTPGALATKFVYAIGRDALTNTFREFWPDIATHVLHRHP